MYNCGRHGFQQRKDMASNNEKTMKNTEVVVHSNTAKNGASLKKEKTKGGCVMCNNPIPRIAEVINATTKIPNVLTSIISQYLTVPTQRIGYVLLHRPSRSAYHVACVLCHESMVNSALSSFCPIVKINQTLILIIFIKPVCNTI